MIASHNVLVDFLRNLFKTHKDQNKTAYHIGTTKTKKENCQFKSCAECTNDLHCLHNGINKVCGWNEKCAQCERDIDCPAGQFCQAGSCSFGNAF